MQRCLVDVLEQDVDAAAEQLAASVAPRSWRALELCKLSLGLQERDTETFDVSAVNDQLARKEPRKVPLDEQHRHL